MLRQFWNTQIPPEPRLFSSPNWVGARILEIGAGTGVVPACLFAQPQWIAPGARPLHWISTDRKENLSLIRKNVDTCVPSDANVRIVVQELDWVHLHGLGTDPFSQRTKDQLVASVLQPFSESHDTTYPDVILCMDCVYNPALHEPLVTTLKTFCAPRHTTILLIMQLREVDNTMSFLKTWASQTEHVIYHLEDELLPPLMRQNYAAWLAWHPTHNASADIAL